ncbi:hypothetical protein AB0L70_16980 [Kribbella sp. NPDC051952]|uniref:hypothetical protein n=1 Tax=Kribbella sp. NPDC051952 TaxID=3154851 RepID=UPI00341676D9
MKMFVPENENDPSLNVPAHPDAGTTGADVDGGFGLGGGVSFGVGFGVGLAEVGVGFSGAA